MFFLRFSIARIRPKFEKNGPNSIHSSSRETKYIKLLSYLASSQIWLNPPVDYCHFGYNTKFPAPPPQKHSTAVLVQLIWLRWWDQVAQGQMFPQGNVAKLPKESMGPIPLLQAPSCFSFGPRNGAKLQRKNYPNNHLLPQRKEDGNHL